MAEKSHVHTDDKGILHVCYHHCRTLFTNWQFWLGTFAAFPLEHWIWEKCWPFFIIAKWMGLD